jgi:Holliday junction resolvase RusA-like endonuclease
MSKRLKSTDVDSDAPIEPEGTVICEGEILGRAVPWKAPTICRNGGVNKNERGYKSFESWKEKVNGETKKLMRHKRPYGGHVRFDVTFYLAPKPGLPPDRSNLLKAFEDATQSAAIRNDTQIVDGTTARVITAHEPERVAFVFTAVDGSKYKASRN